MKTRWDKYVDMYNNVRLTWYFKLDSVSTFYSKNVYIGDFIIINDNSKTIYQILRVSYGVH